MFAIEGDIHNSDNNKSQASLSTSTCSYDIIIKIRKSSKQTKLTPVSSIVFYFET